MKLVSHVQLFLTPWTVAYKAPLSLEFSSQEYWNGLPFPMAKHGEMGHVDGAWARGPCGMGTEVRGERDRNGAGEGSLSGS